MANIAERSERAAPFYFQYWDLVPTESKDDITTGPRNVVAEAIVDLLCFGLMNGVDSDVALEQAKSLLVETKMQETFGAEEDPEE